MTDIDLAVIGGGQSGLATAYAARRAGLTPVLLEAGEEPAGAWPHYYDSLTLFSPARYSELPGRPFGGDPDRYPTRDELAAYLRAYAASLDVDICTSQRVVAIDAIEGGSLRVRSEAGLELTAGLLVAATGGFGTPYRPALLGLDGFEGEVLHAAGYRRPDAFADRRVIVVGGGNSAVQIADELAAVARVTIATRSPMKFARQRVMGRDLHWWLTRSGLDSAPIGRWLRGHTTPVLDDGHYRAALATGNPDTRPRFTRIDGPHVVWGDGDSEPVDVVILATGYRPDLGYLSPTGALSADGFPLHRAGVSTTVPGLGYVGLDYQRSIASATVRGVGRDAQRVVGRLVEQRDRQRRSTPGQALRARCCPAVAR